MKVIAGILLLIAIIMMSIIQDNEIIENTLMCGKNTVYRYTAHDEFIQDYDTNRIYTYSNCK